MSPGRKTGSLNLKRCESCGGEQRVITTMIALRYGSHTFRVPALYFCEGCLMGSVYLAKLALEIQSAEPTGTLAETFDEKPKPFRNRTLFVLIDSIKAAYCRWRGVQA